MKKTFAVVALSLAATLPAFAADDDSGGRVVIGMGLTGGGETLATVMYTDGSSSDIKSGGLVALYGGYEYRFSNRISIQGTLGYHVDNTSASNGDLKFKRYPLEMLGHYGISEQFRIGGGLRYVMNPRLTGNGFASGADYKFDNTVGLVLEAEYLFDPKAGIKVRAVSEKYKQEGGNTDSISGNHGGVYASFYF